MSEKQEITVERSDFVFVRYDRKMIKVNFCDILYVESLSDYVKIHLVDNKIIRREAISHIEVKLPQKDFIRTHRSFIVSLAGIDSFTHEDIQVSGTEIPISRSFKKEVLRKLESQ